MTDAYGDITLTQSYTSRLRPRRGYGEVLYSEGTAATDYSFTGENYDPQTGLAYLRARYYSSVDGRFISKDIWEGDYYYHPLTINHWSYVIDNPINFVDPTGQIIQGEESLADGILSDLKNNFNIIITRDYGWGDNSMGYEICGTLWYEGAWTTLDELTWKKEAIEAVAVAMGGTTDSSYCSRIKQLG